MGYRLTTSVAAKVESLGGWTQKKKKKEGETKQEYTWTMKAEKCNERHERSQERGEENDGGLKAGRFPVRQRQLSPPWVRHKGDHLALG